MNVVSKMRYQDSVLLFLLLSTALGNTGPILDEGKRTLLQTADGLILLGDLADVREGAATLRTAYGNLRIPLESVTHVDGNLFDSTRGIVREHTVTLHPNGNATLEYSIPIKKKKDERAFNVLVPGTALAVTDTEGNTLPFVSVKAGRYSRCKVTLPEYRVSAVVVRVLQRKSVQLEGGRAHYAYRYTPRSRQTFVLRVNVPEGARVVNATPAAVHDATDSTVVWEAPLERQSTVTFDLSFCPIQEP